MYNSYQYPSNQFNPNFNQRFSNNNGINWVQGTEGAKAFQLPPNSNTILMDSEQDRFYIKRCDDIGMCTLRTFKYEEITDSSSTSNIDPSQFVTKAELESMLAELKGDITIGKQPISTTKQSKSDK